MSITIRSAATFFVAALFSALILIMGSQPAAALDTTTITTNFQGDKNDVVYDFRRERKGQKGPEIAFVYPDENQAGVTVFAYNAKTATWSDGDYMDNQTMAGQASMKIRDLQVSHDRDIWLITWISEHYDSDGALLGDLYNMHIAGRTGAASDVTHYLDTPTINNGTGSLTPFPPRSLDDDMGLIYRDGDEMRLCTVGPFCGKGDENDMSIADVAEPGKFVVVPNIGTKNQIVSVAGNTMYWVWYGVASDDLAKINQKQLKTGSDLHVLNVIKGKDGDIHILYYDGTAGEIRMMRLDKDGAKEKDVKVFGANNLAGDPDAADFRTKFNDFGSGQYVVMWHKKLASGKKPLKFTSWRTGGFMPVRNFQKKGGLDNLPQIRMFGKGRIQIVASLGGVKNNRADYSPKTKKWSQTNMTRKYSQWTWLNTTDRDAVLNNDNNTGFDLFYNTNKSTRQEQVRFWKVKKSNFAGADKVKLPKGYRLRFHAKSYGYSTKAYGYYIMILQKGSKLKAVIEKEAALLGN